MDLAAVVDDIASRGRGHGALRVELLAGSHPPGAGEDREEAVVGMEVRAAHVPREPLNAHDVRARLAGVAEQHGRLVRPRRVPHPLDLFGGLEIDRGAVDVAGAVARGHGQREEQNGEEDRAGHEVSLV